MVARAVFALLAAVLLGCGDSSTPPPASPSNNDDVDTTFCEAVADWNATAQGLEQMLATQLNLARVNGAMCGTESLPGAPELYSSPDLTCAARVHSLDMVTRGYVDHTSPDGDTAFDRIRATGYDYVQAGENIASGWSTAEDTLAQWLGSAPHCRSLLDAAYTEYGIGYAAGGPDGHVWTLVLAAPE